MADQQDDQDQDDAPAPEPKPKATPKPPARPAEPDPEDLTPEDLVAELARARKALKSANQEAQQGREARKRIREIEEEEEKRREAALSEDEKRKARLAQAEQRAKDAEEKAAALLQKNNQLIIDGDVEAEATRQGAVNPKVIVKMVRGDGGLGIEIDQETGKTTGVKDVVLKVLKEYPDLAGASRGGGTPPRDGGGYRMPPRSNGAPKTDRDRQLETAQADVDYLSRTVNYGM